MHHSQEHAAKSILQQHDLFNACVPQSLLPDQWVQERQEDAVVWGDLEWHWCRVNAPNPSVTLLPGK